MSWRRRLSAAFFAVTAGGTVALGVELLVSGYLPDALTCFGIAALALIIGVFIWLNWRILELNRTLIEENQRLRAEKRSGAVYLMPRPRPPAEEHGEPGDAP
jgi:hypothetical protein